jgi:hypothetical protein
VGISQNVGEGYLCRFPKTEPLQRRDAEELSAMADGEGAEEVPLQQLLRNQLSPSARYQTKAHCGFLHASSFLCEIRV